MINLFDKTYDFIKKMINLLNKTHEFIKNINLLNIKFGNTNGKV